TGLPGGPSGNITLGFRAEDAEIVASGGQIAAPMYSIELLGEASMITWRLGGALVSVKTHKDYRAEIGEVVSARIPADICHLFDTASEERIALP
ncbi:MAG: ABC transporter ATP-binding protein, partial [Thalassobium sp.]